MTDSSPGYEPIQPELLFATPLFSRTLPSSEELNSSLAELFLLRERMEGHGTRKYSNVGGWHSEIDLQRTRHADLLLVLKSMRELALEATERLLSPGERGRRYTYDAAAWANISREGDYNTPHVHMATWSAVYYVSVPPQCDDDGLAGKLELLDPRPATAMVGMPGRFFATRHTITPRPGLLVLFPASIMHLVHPFRGAGERISIACDLTLERL